MPKMNAVFTDRALTTFYVNFLKHYKECKPRSSDTYALYNEMYAAIYNAVELPQYGSSLFHLNPAEKLKVYSAFNTMFYALLNQQQRQTFTPLAPHSKPVVIRVYQRYDGYRADDSFLFNWLLFNSLMHDCHHHGRIFSSGDWNSGNYHGHSASSSTTDWGQVIALLVVIALAAIAAVLAFMAMYYMLNSCLEGCARFYYNEGWLKASLMMATSVAFGAGANIASFTVLAGPLTSLAVLAGLNPIGILITGAVFLTIIGAGLGCFSMDLLYGSVAKNCNKDSMDPTDPLRYRLTEKEEKHLVQKGIDPVSVKCAIVALRASMVQDKKDKSTALFFHRSSEVSKALHKIRQLRAGAISSVEVGELFFNCKIGSTQPQSQQPPAYYSLSDSQLVASAPPVPLYWSALSSASPAVESDYASFKRV